jgi:hypothetical protein
MSGSNYNITFSGLYKLLTSTAQGHKAYENFVHDSDEYEAEKKERAAQAVAQGVKSQLYSIARGAIEASRQVPRPAEYPAVVLAPPDPELPTMSEFPKVKAERLSAKDYIRKLKKDIKTREAEIKRLLTIQEQLRQQQLRLTANEARLNLQAQEFLNGTTAAQLAAKNSAHEAETYKSKFNNLVKVCKGVSNTLEAQRSRWGLPLAEKEQLATDIMAMKMYSK